MHGNFRYDSEKLCIAKFTSLHPAATVLTSPLPACTCSISSSFDILHSRLAEIDGRPYEIDGNQPDFGYDWIDTIIWLLIPAKTTKVATKCDH